MNKKISVILPNFNHAKFLPKRLESIISQTYPIYELIIIDDSSTDNSVEIIKGLVNNINFPIKFIINNQNIGNVFKQWHKGLSLAKGDYIWIAESDDYCENNFLEEVIKPFDNEEVVLSYSQSAMIDEKDKVIEKNYLFYTKEISSLWEEDFIVDGIELLFNAFYIKNVIPNVSAVVFKKDELKYIFKQDKENIFKFNVAGDWYVYILLAQFGKIAFSSKVLNYHRNHAKTCRNRFDYINEIFWIREKILKILYNMIYKQIKDIPKNLEKKNNQLVYNLSNIIKSLHYINISLHEEIKLKRIALDNLKILRKYKNIAIFGVGKSGKMTYEFIKEYYPEKIKYFIDDNVMGRYEDIPIVTTEEFLEKYQNEVDLVVCGKYQHLNPKLKINIKIPFLKMENIL